MSNLLFNLDTSNNVLIKFIIKSFELITEDVQQLLTWEGGGDPSALLRRAAVNSQHGGYHFLRKELNSKC